MSNISFDNPWLLFIALPLLAAVLVPFFITVRKDNANAHNIASMCIHVVMCICFTLAISGMSFEKVVTETEVYVLADVSYSSEHTLDEVQSNIYKIEGKLPRNSRMGVICFGRDYKLLSDLGESVPDVTKAEIDRSATDIASALRYAGNLFDDNVIKRIIVITDGAETVANNNVIKVVGTLRENGVYVDAVYLDNKLPADVKEVQIDGADATHCTYLDKAESVDILVRANCGGGRIDGYINLFKNGEQEIKRSVSLYDGLNVVTLPLSTAEIGTFDYEVTVETAAESDDYTPYNNSCMFTQLITDERKILYIGTTAADVAAGRRIYGNDNVDYITDTEEVPLSVEQLCVYDEIALCNFDVRTLRSADMFTSSLTALVDDYGKTLTTYGNTFVQENNGEDTLDNAALRQLASLLPVNIGNPDQDTRLFAIVLDISISMNFASRFGVAKRAAKELLNVLNPTDMVMVVGFSGGVKELLQPTYLTAVTAIKNEIDKASAENGTNLSAALKHTYDLMPSRFHDKRVIIISDGMNPSSDNAAAKQWANTMTQEKIAVSAIGIYADSAGDSLLKEIVYNAYAGSSVFYKNIAREQDIDVTISDIQGDTSEVRIEGDIYAVSVKRSDEAVVRGIESINSVRGFWYNSAKDEDRVTTVLTAKYFRDRVTSFDVPLYAYRSGGKGKGKVASFLSDISSDWTYGWTDGSNGGKFLSNIPDATLPDERVTTPFVVAVEGNGTSTTIKVKTSATLQNSVDFTVALTDTNGLVSQKPLVYDSGTYSATFATDAPGRYSVHVDYAYLDLHFQSDADFSVPYYAEYDSFATHSRSYLYRLLTTGGRILDLDAVATIENTDSEYTTYTFSFMLPLMILCAVLFVIDVIIRQLKWKDVTSFFSGLRRRK